MPIPSRMLIPPYTVSPECSAREAAQLIRDRQIGALVIVDEKGRPEGVVTDRDLALEVLCRDADPSEVRVSKCMTRPAITIPAEESLVTAARIMRRHVIRRLPIVDHCGVVVGILTADDLIWEFADGIRWIAEASRVGIEMETHPPARGVTSVFGNE